MNLRAVGAGLPRTGTQSLATALEHLLGAPCYHMRAIPGHPFDLGRQWHEALRGQRPDWDAIYDGYAAAVDWPTSMFWRELSEPQLLMKSYDDHLAAVRATIPPGRLMEWWPEDGWDPLCRALDVPVPDVPFPWQNRRSDWS